MKKFILSLLILSCGTSTISATNESQDLEANYYTIENENEDEDEGVLDDGCRYSLIPLKTFLLLSTGIATYYTIEEMDTKWAIIPATITGTTFAIISYSYIKDIISCCTPAREES